VRSSRKRSEPKARGADTHLYWIRREGKSEPATASTFAVLYHAQRFAEHLANWRGVRLEIVRGDGTVAIAVDPDGEPGSD
jgi:hypothetical protein